MNFPSDKMDAGGHSMQYLLEKEFDLKKTF